MSQNGPYSGPPWPNGSADESYAQPSDPWGSSAAIPHQPYPGPSPAWRPPAAPQRRNLPMVVLVAVLSVLVGGGLATAAWLLLDRGRESGPPAAAPTTAPAHAAPRPQTSADARFVTKGQCVRNEGNNTQPELRIVTCAANTYRVLKRIDGRTTGEKDAMSKCAKVSGYTKWYYYDTDYDDVDFVLCLRDYKPSR